MRKVKKVKKVKKLQAAPSRPARSAVADEYSAAYATWGVMIQRGAGPAVAADALDFWALVSRWCPRSPRTPLLGPQLRPTHRSSGAAVAADALHCTGSRAESPRPPGGVQARDGKVLPTTRNSARVGNGLRPEARWGRRLGAAQAWGANLAPKGLGKHVRIGRVFPVWENTSA